MVGRRNSRHPKRARPTVTKSAIGRPQKGGRFQKLRRDAARDGGDFLSLLGLFSRFGVFSLSVSLCRSLPVSPSLSLLWCLFRSSQTLRMTHFPFVPLCASFTFANAQCAIMNPPAQLKPLLRIVQTAQQIEKHDAVVAWCCSFFGFLP